MKQYAMVVDLNKCLGCHTCSVTCKTEWQLPADANRSWLERLGPERTRYGLAHTFYSGRCNHCDEPACVSVCPVPSETRTFSETESSPQFSVEVAATWKDPLDGTVQVDRERCIGCGACVEACPYGARYLLKVEDRMVADKCTFCVERLADGLQPACVVNCLSGALFFGDLNDHGSKVYGYVKNGAVRISSSRVNIGPNVYYYGKKKDIKLLAASVTPVKMPHVSSRRTFLRQVINFGKKV